MQANATYKNGQSRIYFLIKLRWFDVGRDMLFLVYQSVVASWGNIISTDRSRINKFIRMCVAGMEREAVSIEKLVEGKRTRAMMKSVRVNGSHPLHSTMVAQETAVFLSVCLSSPTQ